MNAHYRQRGHSDINFAISPDGGKIAFSALGYGGRDLYLLDLKTWRVTPLIQSSGYEGDPSYSPDGKLLVYTVGNKGDRADHLFTCSLDGTQAKQLTNEDCNDRNPSFSPDGSKIVFVRDLKYNWGGLGPNWIDNAISTISKDGSKLHQVNQNKNAAYSPQFSRDGKSILFGAVILNKDFPADIYLTKADGTQTPKKLTLDGDSRDAVLSPDGKQIAFTKGYRNSIYLMNIKTRLIRCLHIKQLEQEQNNKQSSRNSFKSHFTPDGEQIYFLVESWPDGANGTPHYSLWRVDVNGKNSLEIADSSLFDDPLHWTPSTKN